MAERHCVRLTVVDGVVGEPDKSREEPWQQALDREWQYAQSSGEWEFHSYWSTKGGVSYPWTVEINDSVYVVSGNDEKHPEDTVSRSRGLVA